MLNGNFFFRHTWSISWTFESHKNWEHDWLTDKGTVPDGELLGGANELLKDSNEKKTIGIQKMNRFIYDVEFFEKIFF